jgi:DeoR family glycerol-3-phosphate regulon repressor
MGFQAVIPDITERQASIAERVRGRGFQTVADLAEHFGVTTQTIRRDIGELSELGLLKRRHGGVEPREPNANLSFGERRILNLDAKQRIARAVAERIPNGASLAVSIGTTPELVVRALSGHRGLRVFTNNITAALGACDIADAEVAIPGGTLRLGARDVIGRDVEDFFARFKVDIGIYGVGGVDPSGELLDFHEDEVRAREAIRHNCRQVFLVLDATKFGRPAHVRGGHITEADVVFCDATPPADIARALDAAGRETVVELREDAA